MVITLTVKVILGWDFSVNVFKRGDLKNIQKMQKVAQFLNLLNNFFALTLSDSIHCLSIGPSQ